MVKTWFNPLHDWTVHNLEVIWTEASFEPGTQILIGYVECVKITI